MFRNHVEEWQHRSNQQQHVSHTSFLHGDSVRRRKQSTMRDMIARETTSDETVGGNRWQWDDGQQTSATLSSPALHRTHPNSPGSRLTPSHFSRSPHSHTDPDTAALIVQGRRSDKTRGKRAMRGEKKGPAGTEQTVKRRRKRSSSSEYSR